MMNRLRKVYYLLLCDSLWAGKIFTIFGAKYYLRFRMQQLPPKRL